MDETRATSPLKAALTRAGLTTEQFADQLGVDVKTVRRWTYGRIPYPRHRIAITHALDLPQHQLWPDLPDSATHDPTDTAPARAAVGADPVAGYPGPDDPAIPPLEDLVAAATRQIDISDDTLLPPPDDADPRLYVPFTQLADPTLLQVLIAKSREGVPVRVLVARAEADLAPLLDLPTVQVRVGDPRHTIHRADDQLLLGISDIAPTREPRPVLHVRRQITDGLFDRLLDSYELEWDNADPVNSPNALAKQVADVETEREHDRDRFGNAPEFDEPDEPPDPSPASGPPPRRWPRRPQ